MEGFIVGGTSSRFWMLRKHFNSFEFVAQAGTGADATNKSQMQDLNALPFYSWECITMRFSYRDTDFVIQNDTNMQILIEFLLYELKSADGRRGTAIPYYESIFLEQQATRKNALLISKSTKREVTLLKQFNIFNFTNTVLKKYRIMNVRMKISYSAY